MIRWALVVAMSTVSACTGTETEGEASSEAGEGQGTVGSTEGGGTGTDGGDVDGSGSGGGSTGGLAPRPEVVVYRGNDGELPEGNDWLFELATERFAAAGMTVSDVVDWPAAFDAVGVVILVVNAAPFSAEQIEDLEAVMAGGGIVIVSNEWSAYAESENLNVVLADLGSALSFEDDLIADASGGTIVVEPVAEHALTGGVESLVVAAGSAVLGCEDGRELLMADDRCMLGAEAHGPGWLLAFGDSNVLDDHVLEVADETQNFALLANLIAAVP